MNENKQTNREYVKSVLTCDPVNIFFNSLKTDSGKIAYKRTGHVLKISLWVYVSLCCLTVFLIWKYNYMALPFMLIVLLSAFPFAKYIVVPQSEKKRGEIERSVLGETREEQRYNYSD